MTPDISACMSGMLVFARETTVNSTQPGFQRNLHYSGMEWPPSTPDLHFLNAWFISLAGLPVQGEWHNKHKNVVLWKSRLRNEMLSLGNAWPAWRGVAEISWLCALLLNGRETPLCSMNRWIAVNSKHIGPQKKKKKKSQQHKGYFLSVQHSAQANLRNVKDTKSLCEALRCVKDSWRRTRHSTEQKWLLTSQFTRAIACSRVAPWSPHRPKDTIHHCKM